MQRLSIIILAVFFIAMPSRAFEVDVFRNGMTKDQVREALKSYTFDRVQEFSTKTLIAYDQPEKGTNRQFVFDFCNDKLSGLQQDMAPSMRNVTIVLNNYITKYGQPFKVDAQSSVTSIGDKNEILFYWRRGLDIFGIKYNETMPVEQLVLQFDTPNNCWQTPR